jgi:hypothetical protein
MMNQRIRVADPDFSESRLIVVQFGKGDNTQRVVREFESVDESFFSFDELNQMIDETYRLWIEVLGMRAEEVRRKPTGSTPLGY